jgi:hypothetical protein
VISFEYLLRTAFRAPSMDTRLAFSHFVVSLHLRKIGLSRRFLPIIFFVVPSYEKRRIFHPRASSCTRVCLQPCLPGPKAAATAATLAAARVGNQYPATFVSACERVCISVYLFVCKCICVYSVCVHVCVCVCVCVVCG